MQRPNARIYIIHRVLVRLEEQAVLAHQYGRTKDAYDLSRLIGKLEYQHFACAGFETAVSNA